MGIKTGNDDRRPDMVGWGRDWIAAPLSAYGDFDVLIDAFYDYDPFFGGGRTFYKYQTTPKPQQLSSAVLFNYQIIQLGIIGEFKKTDIYRTIEESYDPPDYPASKEEYKYADHSGSAFTFVAKGEITASQDMKINYGGLFSANGSNVLNTNQLNLSTTEKNDVYKANTEQSDARKFAVGLGCEIVKMFALGIQAEQEISNKATTSYDSSGAVISTRNTEGRILAWRTGMEYWILSNLAISAGFVYRTVNFPANNRDEYFNFPEKETTNIYSSGLQINITETLKGMLVVRLKHYYRQPTDSNTDKSDLKCNIRISQVF